MKRRALAAGAQDFISKPFDLAEVQLRIDNLLHARFLHLALREQNDALESQVRARTAELERAQRDIAERLARAADYRDDDTGRYIYRVGRMAALLAQELGWSPADVELIGQAAPLHDVGKIGIPDRILLKPGKLTPEEFERMKQHTTIGARLLAGSPIAVLQMARDIALRHHERWDGTGYAGLAGTAIPLAARITTVVDVFDALTHRRPYKEPWPVEAAVEEIVRQSGRHFDPEIVSAFLRVLEHGRRSELHRLVGGVERPGRWCLMSGALGPRDAGCGACSANRPNSMARVAAWVRLDTPSLARIRSVWLLTVAWPMTSCSAI